MTPEQNLSQNQNFQAVAARYKDVPYMTQSHAKEARRIIEENNCESLLEIGFAHGKSSAYFAAIAEDRKAGHLVTIDRISARNRSPNIGELLSGMGLSHRVTPLFAERSYTWELQKLIRQTPQPKFDFCYFDGGHTWDMTGFGVLLVDMLLKPGGVLLLDDLDWSMAKSPAYKANPKMGEKYSEDELSAKSVRLVWDTILPHLGYEKMDEITDLRWGVARKLGRK